MEREKHCIDEAILLRLSYRTANILRSSIPCQRPRRETKGVQCGEPVSLPQHPPSPADRSQTPDLAEIIANSHPLKRGPPKGKREYNSSLLSAEDISHQPGWRFCGSFEENSKGLAIRSVSGGTGTVRMMRAYRLL